MTRGLRMLVTLIIGWSIVVVLAAALYRVGGWSYSVRFWIRDCELLGAVCILLCFAVALPWLILLVCRKNWRGAFAIFCGLVIGCASLKAAPLIRPHEKDEELSLLDPDKKKAQPSGTDKPGSFAPLRV